MEQLQPYIDDAIKTVAPYIVELVIAAIVAAIAWLRARAQVKAASRAVDSVENDYAPFPGPEKQAIAVARVASLPPGVRPRLSRARKLIDKAVAAKNAERGKRWPQP